MKRFLIPLFAGLLILGVRGLSEGGDKDAVTPVNLEKLNTPGDEDDPFIAANGLSLYYAHRKEAAKKTDAEEKKGKKDKKTDKAPTFSILVSKRSSGKDAWPVGKVVFSSPDADYRSPFLYKSDLYFASNEVPDEKLAALKNFDIFKRIAMQAHFPLPGETVNEKTDEMHPWITASGKEFYFSRKTADGWKLFVATGPVPGPIGKAKAVGFETGFHHASLSADGLTMYLQGPLDNDRWGLFRSKRAKVSEKWSPPVALSALNNAEGKRGDMSPCLSAEGSKLYFASDRSGGKGGLDIWYVMTSQLK
jgi:hypothetical protein